MSLIDRDYLSKAGFTLHDQHPRNYWRAEKRFRPGVGLSMFLDDHRPGVCSVFLIRADVYYPLPDRLIETTDDLEWLVQRMERLECGAREE